MYSECLKHVKLDDNVQTAINFTTLYFTKKDGIKLVRNFESIFNLIMSDIENIKEA